MREEPSSIVHSTRNEIIWEVKSNTQRFGHFDGGTPFMVGGHLYMKTNSANNSFNAVRLMDGKQFTFSAGDECIPKQISITIKEDK